MAEYKVTSSNYNDENTITMFLGESLSITGSYNTSLFTAHGLDGKTSVPGCSYSTVYSKASNAKKLSGTPTSYGRYSLQKGKVAAANWTDGAHITLEVVTYFYQNLYFNANGGSGGPGTQSYTVARTAWPAADGVYIPTDQPSRSGYVFAGWATSSTATSPGYYPGGYIDVPYDTNSGVGTTLYAVWWKTWYANLVYSANGGSGAPASWGTSTNAPSQPGDVGTNVSSTTPSRGNYQFQGWAESSTASTASWTPGSWITVPYSDSNVTTKTIHAVWWGIWYSVLKYDASGGSGAPGSHSVTITQYSKPSAYSHIISSSTPTRQDHTFQGWDASPTVEVPLFHPGDPISVAYDLGSSGGTTLYAIWWGNWYSILKFDANEGSDPPPSQVDTITQKEQPSAKAHVISSLIPTREGHTFKGWSESPTATAATYQPGDTVDVDYIIGSAGGTTLYAVWEEATESPTMKVKHNSAWADAVVNVRRNGAWVQPAKVYGRHGGAWHEGS